MIIFIKSVQVPGQFKDEEAAVDIYASLSNMLFTLTRRLRAILKLRNAAISSIMQTVPR